MLTKTEADKRAAAKLAGKGERELLELWAETSRQIRPGAPDAAELALVRGWLMDALEAVMGVERFEAWLDDPATDRPEV